MGTTQAGFLQQLWEREEPKADPNAGGAHVLVLTGDAMERVMNGIAEANRGVIDVTPRRTAPAVDDVLAQHMEDAKNASQGQD